MIVTSTSQILEGSLVLRTLRLGVQESCTSKILICLAHMLFRVTKGSRLVDYSRRRIVPLFIVNDYLEQPSDIETELLHSSLIWKRLIEAVEKISRIINWPGGRSIVAGSCTSSLMAAHGTVGRISLHRKAMSLLILYILVFYLIRVLLMLCIPHMDKLIGWASGMVLGLLITGVYLYLSRITDTDAQE